MFDGKKEQAEKILQLASLFGESYAVKQVQAALIPHVIEIFGEHEATEVRRMILTDYALVKNHTPEGVRSALQNLGSNRQTRQLFEQLVLDRITPENVLAWMKEPGEWLEGTETLQQRRRLKECAAMIEETEGGEAWLEEQVLDVYRMANIIPEDTKPVQVND